MTSQCTIASAPGKVLLAGGYLVLEQSFTGLVVGTSARFYTVIRPQTNSTAGYITVHSPQFENATWIYQAIVTDKVSFKSMYINIIVIILCLFFIINFFFFFFFPLTLTFLAQQILKTNLLKHA